MALPTNGTTPFHPRRSSHGYRPQWGGERDEKRDRPPGRDVGLVPVGRVPESGTPTKERARSRTRTGVGSLAEARRWPPP
jgi:hypothetical protein